MRIPIALIMIMLTVSANAQNFDYQCFRGRLSNPSVKDITEVRMGITKTSQAASFIVFYAHGVRYSTDIFCDKNSTGRCNLLDDSGTFKILTKLPNKMTIQFDGMPKAIIRNGEKLPVVDSNIKLKTPIQMNLMASQKSNCVY